MEMFEGKTCNIIYHGDASGAVIVCSKDGRDIPVDFNDLYKFVMKMKAAQIETKVETFVDKFVDGVSKLFKDDEE